MRDGWVVGVDDGTKPSLWWGVGGVACYHRRSGLIPCKSRSLRWIEINKWLTGGTTRCRECEVPSGSFRQ